MKQIGVLLPPGWDASPSYATLGTFGTGLRGLGLSPGQVIVLCLGQDTLLSQCLSPPRSINGNW